jgi:putative thiamine transport system ATP-binding protein
LDEPFSNLDMQLREEIRAFTFDTLRAANVPAFLVTHDLADAQAAGGEIIAL